MSQCASTRTVAQPFSIAAQPYLSTWPCSLEERNCAAAAVGQTWDAPNLATRTMPPASPTAAQTG
eukprot:11170876-Lingulodinium_polyedra.AAC.1